MCRLGAAVTEWSRVGLAAALLGLPVKTARARTQGNVYVVSSGTLA